MIAVVDSGVANLTSVVAAFERMDVAVRVTSNPHDIATAERVLLPGVGSAGAAMKALQDKGLVPVLRSLRQPVLGICLGMQVMFDASAESDGVSCLGVIDGAVLRLSVEDGTPLPHMGWNRIKVVAKDDQLLDGIDDGAYMYFVHSYAAPVGERTLAVCTYGQDFAAICAYRNFRGCQFHPERSGDAGARLLRNFCLMEV